ncbi:MAG: hypothetical protein ACO1TE_18350 [Prosthecobacter sp.]
MQATDTVIEDLTQLAELDATKRRLEPQSDRYKELTLQTDKVRLRLPAAILNHYDPRIVRGKHGAAKMRNNTCGGCHISLPSGQLSDMRRDGVAFELQVCGNCSILLLPADAPPEAPAPVAVEPAPAAVKKPRKNRAKAEVVA